MSDERWPNICLKEELRGIKTTIYRYRGKTEWKLKKYKMISKKGQERKRIKKYKRIGEELRNLHTVKNTRK